MKRSNGTSPARGGEILTTAEARQLLRIGRTKLWRLTQSCTIPSYRLGDSRNSSLRYRRSELLRWLGKQRLKQVDEGVDAGSGGGGLRTNPPPPVVLEPVLE